MKLTSIFSALTLTVAVAMQPTLAADRLSFVARPVPHAEILEQLKPTTIKYQGVELDSEVFGAYSNKIDKIEDLKEGARVAIPNDPSNGARALLLLEQHGLIELEDPWSLLATARDVVENPKKLRFTELEAATLARVLDDVDLALINTNYAIEAGLNPLEDPILIEGSESLYASLLAIKQRYENEQRAEKLINAINAILIDGSGSPYPSLVIVKEDNEKDQPVEKLIKAENTDDENKFIEEKYEDAVVPAF